MAHERRGRHTFYPNMGASKRPNNRGRPMQRTLRIPYRADRRTGLQEALSAAFRISPCSHFRLLRPTLRPTVRLLASWSTSIVPGPMSCPLAMHSCSLLTTLALVPRTMSVQRLDQRTSASHQSRPAPSCTEAWIGGQYPHAALPCIWLATEASPPYPWSMPSKSLRATKECGTATLTMRSRLPK